MCFPTTAHTRTTSETLEWLQISMWCYIRHIKIKSMFINTVSSCVFQYVHCTSEVLSSEVSFPEELFEDGFIARSRQAGEAPQSRFLVGVVLPPSWGQQRGVGAPASCRTVWWLVSHHQGHTVVGTSFQASARRRMGSRFERLESCWKREMNICWWITSEAFYITGVKKKKLQWNLMWRSVSDAFCRATQGRWILGNQGRGTYCMFQTGCDSSYGLTHHYHHHHLGKAKAEMINRRAE